MKALLQTITAIPEVSDLLRRIKTRPAPAVVWGLSAVHKAHLISAIGSETRRPVVIISADEVSAQKLISDLSVFSGKLIQLLPTRDPIFYDVDSGATIGQGERIAVLSSLFRKNDCTVVTVEALALRTLPPDILQSAVLTLHPGDSVDRNALILHLNNMGYTRTNLCEGAGQFSVRGGIIDIFSPGAGKPVRIEFFDTEIDSISVFSVDTQRREEQISEVSVLPALEFLPDFVSCGRELLCKSLAKLSSSLSRKKDLPAKLLSSVKRDCERIETGETITAIDRYMPFLYPDFPCATDYISDDAIVFIDDPKRCAEKLKSLLHRHAEDTALMMENGVVCDKQADCYLSEDKLWSRLADFDPLMLDTLNASGYPITPSASYSIMAKQLPAYAGSLETARQDFDGYLKAGFSVLFLCSGENRAERIYNTLRDEQLPCLLDISLEKVPQPGFITVSVGAVSTGMEYPVLKLAVITEEQLNGASRKKTGKFRKKTENAPKIKSYTDLSDGDLVVHEAYGIGCFVGIEKITVDGIQRDFIKIRYAGTDNLFLPATQLDQLSKYVGAAEESGVKLNKLGGNTEWQKTKARAKGAAKEMAKELITLYAERQRLPGFSFAKDEQWQKEFEDAFDYEETDDQLHSAAQIKKDMESPHPMDRLLCGDVGFGKTEVAFRAIMKCILSGKQAAILVPTTVLARQHYQTAMHRFRGYPVKIGLLSRFVTPGVCRETVRKLSAGTIDLVVGTHKLLQKDIAFKDLGLLVVDEEQRFGVAHKERLKELTKGVDVLTLSATPIPRTLNMALSGIRDMSVLEEAPVGRFPIQTYVTEYNPAIIADAIRRELARGGQVYYLHNRVESIHQTAARIAKLVPEAQIAVGHGKMSQEELEDALQRVIDGEVNVFVCTTIIETGVDIPNVNTLIIEDAERFGLAQLHQLRGRVGRSTRRAYAYFTYKPGHQLTEVAEKRLSAIREFVEFGAGMKIAMRDLEIRGAGNLLGSEQSGHLISVGFEMYMKLLEEAVLEERGEKKEIRTECVADLAISAFIPDSLVCSAGERMDLYHRIAFVRDSGDAEDMTDEIIDRYGDCPVPVSNLIHIALLRSLASSCMISEIKQVESNVNFTLADKDFKAVSAMIPNIEFKGRLLLNAGEKPYIALRLKKGEDVLKMVKWFLDAYVAVKNTD